MANGDLHLLGTLYLDEIKQLNPTNPWRSGTTPGGGNIPVFSAGQSIEIRDTDADDAYKIRWREVNIGSKKLLIADRNILEQVSWNDLNAQNLIFGKEITIDGQQYKLRVLTGGEEKRGGGTGSSYDGGKLPNEWDDIIVNEGNYPGLPKPSSTDLDSNLNDTDKNSAHNQFWNWYYMYSWCQETYKHDGAHRAIRGYSSARHWGWDYATSRYNFVGWRPVLEVLNAPPVISGEDEDLGIKSQPFSYNYTVSDTDGTIVNITEKLNEEVLNSYDEPTELSRELTITAERLKSLAFFKTHTIEIIATDDKGASATRTLTFTRGVESLPPDTPLLEVTERIAEIPAYIQSGKNVVGEAINNVDPSIIIPTNPTFQQLANAIGQISTEPPLIIGNDLFQSIPIVNSSIQTKLPTITNVTDPFTANTEGSIRLKTLCSTQTSSIYAYYYVYKNGQRIHESEFIARDNPIEKVLDIDFVAGDVFQVKAAIQQHATITNTFLAHTIGLYCKMPDSFIYFDL